MSWWRLHGSMELYLITSHYLSLRSHYHITFLHSKLLKLFLIWWISALLTLLNALWTTTEISVMQTTAASSVKLTCLSMTSSLGGRPKSLKLLTLIRQLLRACMEVMTHITRTKTLVISGNLEHQMVSLEPHLLSSMESSLTQFPSLLKAGWTYLIQFMRLNTIHQPSIILQFKTEKKHWLLILVI